MVININFDAKNVAYTVGSPDPQISNVYAVYYIKKKIKPSNLLPAHYRNIKWKRT